MNYSMTRLPISPILLDRFLNRCSTSSSGLGAWFLVRPKSLVLRPSQVLGPPPPGAHQGLRGPRTDPRTKAEERGTAAYTELETALMPGSWNHIGESLIRFDPLRQAG